MTAAHQAVTVFVETVASGEVGALEAILAPEFQILRANGVGYDRKGYLASELPAIDKSFEWRLEDVGRHRVGRPPGSPVLARDQPDDRRHTDGTTCAAADRFSARWRPLAGGRACQLRRREVARSALAKQF
jgi:hypothetical protein